MKGIGDIATLRQGLPMGFPFLDIHRVININTSDMEKIVFNSKKWLSLENLPNEEWKQSRFKNYLVSNYGRIKRKAHVTIPEATNNHTHHRTYTEKISKLTINKYGYVEYRFSEDGRLHGSTIHKIVAEAFIPKPDNLTFINHKNEDKSDNRVENLEWCSAQYNSNYGTCQQRRAKSVRELRRERIVDVDQYSINGTLIRSYHTKGELDDFGFCVKTVLRSCKRQQETANGYVWRFKGESYSKPVIIDSKGGTIRRKIDCFTLDGIFVRTFDNLLDAALFMGGRNKRPPICECANGKKLSAFGYIWKYKSD